MCTEILYDGTHKKIYLVTKKEYNMMDMVHALEEETGMHVLKCSFAKFSGNFISSNALLPPKMRAFAFPQIYKTNWEGMGRLYLYRF